MCYNTEAKETETEQTDKQPLILHMTQDLKMNSANWGAPSFAFIFRIDHCCNSTFVDGIFTL